MLMPLEEMLDRFAAAADTQPAEALRLWTSITEHPGWPRITTTARLAALDDLAAAQSAVGEHDSAVRTATAALAETPADDVDHPYRWSNLAERLSDRFTATGQPADVDRLVAARRSAVEHTRPGADELVVRLSALGDAHRTRWQTTGVPAALNAAIDALHAAVGAAERLDLDPARAYGGLAVVLSDRFDGFGDPADLDAALAAADRAVLASPSGHPDCGTHLLMRATLLSDRYDHAGRVADLEEALGVVTAALDEPGDDDRETARIQNLLSVLLLDRYQLDGEPERLDEAVTWAQAAVATTDGNDPELAGYFTNLGAALRLAFEATLGAVDWSAPEDVELDVTDLRNAIAAHRRATVLSPVGSTDHPKHMSNLGAVLIDAAVLLPDEFDLGEAVAVLREAVAVTSPGSPHRSSRGNNLATALRMRADRTGEPADVAAAVDAFRAACADGERPESVLAAATNWCAWAGERSGWPEIADAARRGTAAADLLHRIQLTRDDQATWLRAADGLAAAGAQALARLGDPVPAVVMAEGGRARLLADALGADRMLLARLSIARPQLADRFAAVTAAHRSRQQRFDPPR